MKGSGLFKHFRSLLAGATLAQLIYICTLPVLTALYLPSDFGSFAVILAASNILASSLGLRYEMAIVMPRQVRDAFHILIMANLLATAIAIILFMSAQGISSHWDNRHLENASPAIILAFLFFSFQSCNYFFHKIELYWTASALMVAKTILIVLFQVLWSNSGNGLLSGQIAGSVAALALCIAALGTYCCRKQLRLSIRRGALLLKAHKRFPTFSLPAALMNSLGSNAPVLLIEALLGKHVAGLFSLASRLVLGPVSLLAGNLNNALVQHIRKRIHNRTPIRPLMLRITAFMSLLGLSVATAVQILVQTGALSFALGEEWKEVGPVLLWLLPITITSMISTSIARFSVFERHDLGLYFQALLLAASTGSILAAGMVSSLPRTTIISYSVAMSLIFALQTAFSLRLARKNDLQYR